MLKTPSCSLKFDGLGQNDPRSMIPPLSERSSIGASPKLLRPGFASVYRAQGVDEGSTPGSDLYMAPGRQLRKYPLGLRDTKGGL